MANDKNMLLLRKSSRQGGGFGARIRFNGNYPDPYQGPSPLGREVMNQHFAGHFGAMRNKSNFGRSRGAFGQTVGIATIQPMTAQPAVRATIQPAPVRATIQPAPSRPGSMDVWQRGSSPRFDRSVPLSPIAGGCVEEPTTIFRADDPNNPEHGMYLEDKYQVTFFDSSTGRRAQVVFGQGNFDANVYEFPVCPPRPGIIAKPGTLRPGGGDTWQIDCIDPVNGIVYFTDGTSREATQSEMDQLIASGRHPMCDIPPPPPPEMPDCCLNTATGVLECADGNAYPVIVQDFSDDGQFAIVTLDVNIDRPPTWEVPICPPDIVVECPPGFTVDANGVCQPPPPPPPPPVNWMECCYNQATGMVECPDGSMMPGNLLGMMPDGNGVAVEFTGADGSVNVIEGMALCPPPPPPPPPPGNGGGGEIPVCPPGMTFNPATGMCEPPPPPPPPPVRRPPGKTPGWPCVQDPPSCINWRGTRPGECYKSKY